MKRFGRLSTQSTGRAVAEGATLEHICSDHVLHAAFARVRTNNGGPGGDSQPIEAFAMHLTAEFTALKHEVLRREYKPRAMKRVPISKADGRVRWLNIPSVRDRVLQTATLMVVNQTFEDHMSAHSWAYRPNRDVARALADVARGFDEGLVWVVDADVQSFFDCVSHGLLLGDLAIWIDDERILWLIAQWLEGFSKSGMGVAQGAPISPLLANAYLHPVDQLMAMHGYAMIRYADDFVVLTRTKADAHRALETVKVLLRQRRLNLNAQKTRILAPGEEFRFLGSDVAAPHERPQQTISDHQGA
jgi:group II intron reverse transcriptase/maturase